MTSRSDAGYAACQLAYKINDRAWNLICYELPALWPIENGIGPKLNVQLAFLRLAVNNTVLDIAVETE